MLHTLRGGFAREAGYSLMTEALKRGVEPGTLVFGVSDVVAIGALSAIRDAGREPGTDIAVAGFDDIPTSRDVRPDLTTVHVPLEDLGYRALRAVIDPDWTGDAAPLPLDGADPRQHPAASLTAGRRPAQMVSAASGEVRGIRATGAVPASTGARHLSSRASPELARRP